MGYLSSIKIIFKDLAWRYKSKKSKFKDCEECGGKISKRASICPHCGIKVLPKPGLFLQILTAVVLLPIAYSIVASLFIETKTYEFLILLFYMYFALLILGMINPLVALPKRIRPSRLKVFWMYGIGSFLLFILAVAAAFVESSR